MTAQEIFHQVCNLKGIEIQEGASAIKFERIDFHYKDDEVSGHGGYEYNGKELSYSVAYQLKALQFDIEHVRENADEFVSFSNIAPYIGSAHIKNGVINKIEIADHPAQGSKKWTFTAKPDQWF